MLPSAVVIKPAEIELLDEFQLNLAKEAVLVILVVVVDSDLQHLVHIADIPGRLTDSLRESFDCIFKENFDSTYKEHFDLTYKEKEQFQLGSKVFVSVGVLKGDSVII